MIYTLSMVCTGQQLGHSECLQNIRDIKFFAVTLINHTACDKSNMYLVLAVDLVAGRVPEAALGEVARQALSAAHVAQAELADVDAGQRDQLLRVRGEVPRLDLQGMDDSIDDN